MVNNNHKDKHSIVIQKLQHLNIMEARKMIRITPHCRWPRFRVIACCPRLQQKIILSLLIVSLTILFKSHECHMANLPTVTSNTNNNNNNNNNNNQNQFIPYMLRPLSTNNLFIHRKPIEDQVGQSGGQAAFSATSTISSPIMNPSQMQPPQPPVSSSPIANLNQNQFQLNPYTKATHEILLELRQQMLTRSIKFDENFRNLLSCSKISLHNMFADTYGLMYEHNTEIFTGMFEGLEQYYAKGEIKLTKSMENFFERLYQKIFQVYNSNMAFAPIYLECATEQLAHLKPFKDVPDKLISGIRHAFVAARTFVQALNNGIDIIKSIISLGQPAQCTHMINEKLLKNNSPTGSSNQQTSTQSRQPCLGFCEQVINRCIGNGILESLNDRWRAYVLGLSDLSNKLSTNYNIETIIAPLDVQISEAIMNFQENAANISYHVFQACGQPISGTEIQLSTPKPLSGAHRIGRRAANSSPLNPVVSNQNRHNQNTNHANHWAAPPKDLLSIGVPRVPDDFKPIGQNSPLLIEEIKTFMLSTKSFWHNLPLAVCTSNYTLGSNASKKQTNCYQERFMISDINSDLRYRNEMYQQIGRLDAMRSKIDSALLGKEIDWSSDSDQDRNIFVPPVISANHRMPLTTSTTTTTTPEPIENEDDEPEEDLNERDENGSGDSIDINHDEETDFSEPIEDIDTDSTTEVVTTDDYTSENSGSTEDPLTAETSSQPNSNNELINNSLDSHSPPLINDILITPPNQAGAQKSSQSSNKLLISNEINVLITFSMLIALLLLSSFQNNQTHAHRPHFR